MKRKFKSFILSMLLISMSLLCACGDDEIPIEEPQMSEPAQEKSQEEETSALATLPKTFEKGAVITATPDLYSDLDLSENYTVRILLLGDKPNDWDRIEGLINEYIEPFNTSISTDFVPWSEYAEQYPRALAGDNDYDLAFTAPWCFLYSEAAKGTFYTLDSRFAGTYMPLTYRYQIPESWDETTLYGSTVAVPSNTMDNNGKMVAIRKDIADELGIDGIENWDDYMNYMLRVAAEVTPETGIYAMAAEGDNKELWDQYRQQFDTFYAMENDYVSMIYQYDGAEPEYEEISFTYETEMFREFCRQMRTLSEARCWGPTVLYGSKSDDEAFADLEGASISWNHSVFTYVELAEAHEGVECGVYFLTPDHLVESEAYSNNCMAILSRSQNPERAAMVLDMFKFDTYLNHLILLGVEGEHYNINDKGQFSDAEKTADYPHKNISLSWAVKNGDVEELYPDTRLMEIEDAMEKCEVARPTVTFIFDDSAVANEMIAINEILTSMVPKLQLGIFPNPDSTIDQMIKRCYSVGLQDVKDEYRSQYESWLATR